MQGAVTAPLDCPVPALYGDAPPSLERVAGRIKRSLVVPTLIAIRAHVDKAGQGLPQAAGTLHLTLERGARAWLGAYP